MKGSSSALRTTGVALLSAKAREAFSMIKRLRIRPEHFFSKEDALVHVATP